MNQPELIIEPGRAEQQYWFDLWRYRELFYFLAWRDVMVRYKQTFIGVAWALIQPLAAIAVLTVVFGKLADMPSAVPYPILVAAGTLPWFFFANGLTGCSNSLIMNANLLSKVYFPRLVVPTSSLVVAFVDFSISFVIIIGLMAWYGVVPSANIIFLPFFILLAFGAAMGVGLWMATLNVEYRDFRYVVPFIVQFGMFASPVGFSADTVPEKYRLLYSMNPMVGVIDGFRWSLLGTETNMYWPGFALSVGLVIMLLTSGIWYFRRMERTFADVI